MICLIPGNNKESFQFRDFLVVCRRWPACFSAFKYRPRINPLTRKHLTPGNQIGGYQDRHNGQNQIQLGIQTPAPDIKAFPGVELTGLAYLVFALSMLSAYEESGAKGGTRPPVFGKQANDGQHGKCVQNMFKVGEVQDLRIRML